MFAEISKWIVNKYIGDISSILGLLLTILGFIITITNIKKSKRIIIDANNAVNKVREDISYIDIIAELTEAISIMEEIKRLQRKKAWELLPDRYSNLKKTIISIRSNNSFTNSELIELQSSISHFNSIEKMIDEATNEKYEKLNTAKLNSIMSNRIDKIQEILVNQKMKVGRK